MKLYKLTEQDFITYNHGTKWEVGKTNKVKKCKNPELCSSTVLHAYRNKNLSLLLNSIHANISNPILFECEGDIVVEDWGKCGCFSLTPTKKLKYPKWYTSDKKNDVFIMFSILCAEFVISIYEKQYPNDNRPQKAIEAAKEYLNSKTDAARAAADAARAAADAAARAAAYAAADAAYAISKNIDFCKLADLAVKIIMKENNK